MSSVSLPVTRPTGRALLVGGPDCRERPLGLLKEIGFICVEADDPYAAMVELSRRPQGYRAIVLSLQSVFREELGLIGTVKRRFANVEIWVTDTDSRQAALADAMCLGADGILGEDGLHRVAFPAEQTGRAPNGSTRSGRAGRKARASASPSLPMREASPVAPVPAPTPPPAAAAPPPSSARAPATEHSGNGARKGHARSDVGHDVFEDLDPGGEPVLTAEELRALLHEQPAPPKVEQER